MSLNALTEPLKSSISSKIKTYNLIYFISVFMYPVFRSGHQVRPTPIQQPPSMTAIAIKILQEAPEDVQEDDLQAQCPHMEKAGVHAWL